MGQSIVLVRDVDAASIPKMIHAEIREAERVKNRAREKSVPVTKSQKERGLSAKIMLLSGVCLTWALSSTVAHAQAAPQTGAEQDEGTISDIVVTAQRRSERLQDVPIAITALDSEVLESAGVRSTSDLATVVPGLVFNTQLGGNAQVRIRGIGTAASGPGIENPVATYIDGVYYGAQIAGLLDLRDVAQVAVLKGPQGTLFGRNATGGLIQVTTKMPSHDFGGDISGTLGSRETLGADVYLTGGLSDELAGSVTFHLDNQYKGAGRNVFTGADIRTRRSNAVRGKLLYEPDDATRVIVSGSYSEFSSYGGSSQQRTTTAGYPAGFGPWDSYHDYTVPLQLRLFGGSLTIQHDFGGVTLQSITSYNNAKFFAGIDADQSPANSIRIDLDTKEKEFSQEFQLTSNAKGPLTWVAGLFYYRSRGGYMPFTTYRFAANAVNTYRSLGELDSYAGYAQATYQLGANTNLTGGLRYTIDRRAITTSNVSNTAGTIVTTGDHGEHTFQKLTWRLSLDHHVTQDILAYASYNRGYKSGLYEPQSVAALLLNPETLDAFEIGIKSDLFDRKVRFNVAGYYNSYDNVQVVQIVNSRQTVFNGKGLESYGVDLDLTLAPTRRVTFTGGLALFHGEYGAFDQAFISTPIPGGGNLVTFGPLPAGRKVQNSPDTTWNVSGSYAMPTPVGDVTFRAGYYRNSGWYAAPENRLRQAAYGLLDGSIEWTSGDGTLDLRLEGKNLTNEVYAEQLSASNTGDQRLTGLPRTILFTAGVHF